MLSKAAPEDLVRMAGSAADLRLAVGEYAVHEGDPRALFVVLAGKIEVTKSIDGIARTIGWRAPGQMAIAFIHQFLQRQSPGQTRS